MEEEGRARTSPFVIPLSAGERMRLEAMARRYTSPYPEVICAKIVLFAAEGLDYDLIASHLATPRQIVSKWRRRLLEERLGGMEVILLGVVASVGTTTLWRCLA